MTALLLALGGAVGAMLRFAIDRVMTAEGARRASRSRAFPWGILLVNLSGSLLLGLLVGLELASPELSAGVLGGFTTFSTASLDTVRLYREKRYVAAFSYAFGALAAAVVLATAGIALGAAVTG